MGNKILLILSLCLAGLLSAQKTVFRPTEWSNTGNEYYNRMADNRKYESENFVLFWGDIVGTNPENYSGDLRFNPKSVADTLEVSFSRMIKDLKFINNSATTNFGKYKTVVVILGTFSGGDDRTTGFAHASSYSNTIGALFVHPAAVKDGGALSHEYAHTLQMMMRIQENPGNGTAFAGYDWAGPFFEGHANYMRAVTYAKWADTDGTLTRWLQTRHFMWSSNRHHYTNYHLLFYVQEKDGFNMTRRMWAESKNQEHPLEALKRIKGLTQEGLNDYLWGYASKQVAFDYPIQWNDQVNTSNNFGKTIRSVYQSIKNSMPRYVSRQYTLLSKVAGTSDQYYPNSDWAPQDYGMNIIPLYPTCTGSQRKVTVKFKGHTEVNPNQAGWRYGFVTTKADGTVARYSPMYSNTDGEASFTLETASESNIFFVVFAAPKVHVNYNMDEGYPKQRRYPYELKIANANPEGYQPATEFRTFLKTNGKIHSNGGGWVSNNATVASTVYVGPYAIVRGGNVSGTARIEDYAMVDGGTVSGTAIVRGNACVYNATIANNAIVEGNAWMEGGSARDNANLKGNAMLFAGNYTGTIVMGGDAEMGSCASGVYYQFPYWRNGRTECDGKGVSDASNVDINASFTNFSTTQMAFSTTPTCSTVVVPSYTLSTTVVGVGTISPNTGTFEQGSIQNLTATPGAGYVFSGWSGDAAGNTNPLSVTMTGNKSITATFTKIPVETITLNVEMVPNTNYAPTAVSLDPNRLSNIFGLSTAQISSAFGTTIKYYGVKSDGSLDSVSTANAPGHWFDKTGGTVTYGDQAYLYSEFDMSKLSANVGHYPNKVVVGESYTFKQSLLYTKSTSEKKQVIFVFNVSIKSVITSLEDSEAETQATIFPNPSSQNFKIQLTQPSSVAIYSLEGQLLMDYKQVESITFGEELEAGTYLVKTGNTFHKIVKQ